MSAELGQLQERLEHHFKALSVERGQRKLPVYALEHGLTVEELESMAKGLKRRLGTGGYTLSTHWLLWIVFATEQGYDYDGDEYWYTFGRRMPGWDHGWRPAIRSWFRRFQKEYGGLRPVGPWASNFSIIAWPITHSLLPKDLQSQLARSLYNLRYNLVARLDLPVAELGRYVARMSYGGSSRYENFLQQEALVGSIVLALLGHRAEAGSSILPETLERIVSDLERARSARQWLHDTRKTVESAIIRGAARSVSGQSGLQNSRVPERKPSIRPSLVLRQIRTDEWTLTIEIPSFAEVADLAPELGGFLRTTRCQVAGSPGWRPPGWLLNGSQHRTLEVWPTAGKPVLSFQKPNAAMEHLLASEGTIRSGPTWLFRIGPDGQAIEVLSRLIRPGQSYVLVARGDLPSLSLAKTTSIICRGVTAVRFLVPAALSDELIAEFKKADLSIAETIRVWPAGLAARAWDGEGATEWLENESPVFAIEHDYPLDHYILSLGAGPSVRVQAKPPGQPTFVKLEPLAAGNHVLGISVARDTNDTAERPVEGVISLTVRRPNPWVSGTIGHTGLIVSCEPPFPTLDEFWEGLTQLSVLGPAGRQITVSIELLDGTGRRLGLEQVAQLTLPLGPDSWRNAFAAFARVEKQPWHYLGAGAGRIVVDGEELGVVHIALNRDVAPLRWVWHDTNRTTHLRLVDDHDSETPLQVTFTSFESPVQAVPLSLEDVVTGVEPPSPGGLFVATYGDKNEVLVVSSRKISGGLSGLLIEPVFDEILAEPEEVLSLIKAIRIWSAARLTGSLAAERRQNIVMRLKERLYDVMLGQDWARAESRLKDGKVSFELAVKGLLDCFDKRHRAFAFILARDAHKHANATADARAREFAILAQRYKVAPGAITRPAIDLGEVISGKMQFSDDELLSMIKNVWDQPALAAGERLIQLLGHRPDRYSSPDIAERAL